MPPYTIHASTPCISTMPALVHFLIFFYNCNLSLLTAVPVTLFSKLNAQMHEIQTSLSRVEAKTHKQWNNKYKNKNDGSQQSSRKDQSAPSRSQNSTTTKFEGNPEWCFYHNTCGERARKCKQPCSFNHDSPNVQQLHSKNTSLQHIHLQICKHSTAATVIQGRSQDFSKGGGLKLWKQKP